MKKRFAALILTPILGAVLGYFLVTALQNGWFHSTWQRIEEPPVEVTRLVAMSEDSLWVQSDTGSIYSIESASSCQSGCWLEIPVLPALELDESTVTGDACAPSLPLFGVTEQISQCWKTTWVDYTFTFALRRDGSIYLWQAELFREWAFVLVLIGLCGGAFALFIPTLIVVLILGLRDWRGKRARINPIQAS